VTQEEIAEAVGVSRNWYRRLESGASVRASTKLLDRLAHALALTPDERMTLFTLAIPELGQARIAADSRALLATLLWLRPRWSIPDSATAPVRHATDVVDVRGH
jgi:transcriptional regulator with XRE-family HTH domain